MNADASAGRAPPPQLWVLTPTLAGDREARWAAMLRHLEPVAGEGRLMLLVRQPGADDGALAVLLREAHMALPGLALGVRLDGRVDAVRVRRLLSAAGSPVWLHLAERALLDAELLGWREPLGELPSALLGISRAAHDAAGLRRNATSDLDASLLAPVLAPRSKPEARPLGLVGLLALARQTEQRIVALGGLRPEDVPAVLAHGAYGVASQSGAFDGPVDAWLAALDSGRSLTHGHPLEREVDAATVAGDAQECARPCAGPASNPADP